MNLKHFILFIFFAPAITFAQIKKNNPQVDLLVKQLQPWDNGYKECYAPTINDSVMWNLIDMGKPIAKQLLPYLDSTKKIISIHIILSVIYGDTIHTQDSTISKSETRIVKQREINGLSFTYSVSPDGSIYNIDSATQKAIKEMWRKRIK